MQHLKPRRKTWAKTHVLGEKIIIKEYFDNINIWQKNQGDKNVFARNKYIYIYFLIFFSSSSILIRHDYQCLTYAGFCIYCEQTNFNTSKWGIIWYPIHLQTPYYKHQNYIFSFSIFFFFFLLLNNSTSQAKKKKLGQHKYVGEKIMIKKNILTTYRFSKKNQRDKNMVAKNKLSIHIFSFYFSSSNLLVRQEYQCLPYAGFCIYFAQTRY